MGSKKDYQWYLDKVQDIKSKKRKIKDMVDPYLKKKLVKDLKKEYRSAKRSEKNDMKNELKQYVNRPKDDQ